MLYRTVTYTRMYKRNLMVSVLLTRSKHVILWVYKIDKGFKCPEGEAPKPRYSHPSVSIDVSVPQGRAFCSTKVIFDARFLQEAASHPRELLFHEFSLWDQHDDVFFFNLGDRILHIVVFLGF